MLIQIDFVYVLKILLKLLKTVPYTLSVALIAGIIGLLLSVLIAAVRIRRPIILYQIIGVYISFFRSTPGLIHIFIVYYGLPLVMKQFGIDMSFVEKTFFAIMSLGLFYAAYIAEIIRPAYMSVDRGQHEAAKCIGMNDLEREIRIIIPQALPIAMPGIGNAVIDLIKDTSILFVIGLTDIMGKAKIMISNDYGIKKLEVYVAVGIIYWLIITACDVINMKIEKNCACVKGRGNND